MSILKKSAIRVNVQVSTWQEAIRAAGELLVKNGHAEPAYVDGMVHLATTLGPYIRHDPPRHRHPPPRPTGRRRDQRWHRGSEAC